MAVKVKKPASKGKPAQLSEAEVTLARPLGDRVIIRVDDAVTTLPSGIVLPDGGIDKPQTGEVVAVGPGVWNGDQRRPVDVQIGDRVVFSRFAGSPMDGQVVKSGNLLIVREDDVLAVLGES
jgi:chaperonin GroES